MTKSKAVKALETQVEEQEQLIDKLQSDIATNNKAMEEKLDASQRATEAKLAECQRMMQDQFAQMMNALQRRQNTNDNTQAETASTSTGADIIEILSQRDDMQSQSRPIRNPGRGNRIFDYSKIEAIPEDAEYHDFRVWRERWDANAKNKTIELFSRDEQVTALMDAIGHAAAGIVKSYTSVDLTDPETTVEDVLNALRQHYRQNRSIIADGVDFRKRMQGDMESFTKFRCALDELADDAELCKHCRERQIVEQIIVGINDDIVKDKLLEIDPYPTLEQAVKICHKAEIASKNRKCIDAKKEINKISSYKKSKGMIRRDTSESPDRHEHHEKKRDCKYCGGEPHPRDRCWAKDKICNNCGIRGHLKVKCRTRNRLKDEDEDDSNERYVSTVLCGRIEARKKTLPACNLPKIKVRIYDDKGSSIGALRDVLPDTGSGVNLMGIKDYTKLGRSMKELESQKGRLYGVNGNPIKIKGQAKFMIRLGKEKVMTSFIITDEYKGTLLNQETCKALKIIHRNFPQKMHNDSWKEDKLLKRHRRKWHKTKKPRLKTSS